MAIPANVRPDPIAYPPRGLDRAAAARYIGVGLSKFDQLVDDGRMPKPARLEGRVLWDRLAIDAAFTDLMDGGSKTGVLEGLLG